MTTEIRMMSLLTGYCFSDCVLTNIPIPVVEIEIRGARERGFVFDVPNFLRLIQWRTSRTMFGIPLQSE
jgi:hypothetical protein